MTSCTAETTMKIHVSRVPFEGMRADARYEAQALELDRPPDLRVAQPITVSSFITKAEGVLVVEADIRGRLELVCARCLASFTAPLRATSTLTYQVGPADVVDITDDVRQEIMLTYPMVLLCAPACKGLCRRCGQNLNEQTCAC